MNNKHHHPLSLMTMKDDCLDYYIINSSMAHTNNTIYMTKCCIQQTYLYKLQYIVLANIIHILLIDSEI